MRTSADAVEGAAMDDAIKLKTADISAAAEATCHFMVHTLPFNRTRPCRRIVAILRERVRINHKTIAQFLLFFSRRSSVPCQAEARPACAAASQAMRGRRQKGVL